MRKKITLLLACLLIISGAYSQGNKNKDENFVYLFDGTLIHEKKVELKFELPSSQIIMAGTQKFNDSQVKFYQGSQGYFANIKEFNLLKISFFAKRISAGKINLFEFTQSSVGSRAGSTFKKIHYFNSEFEDIKKVTYANLKSALSDNEESMRLLNEYKKLNTAGTVLKISGGVITAGFALMFINKTIKNKNNPEPKSTKPEFMGIIGGCLISGVGVMLEFPKAKKLRQACDAYNK